MDNILTKEGFLINKKNNISILNKIKEELTVTPVSFNKKIVPPSFNVYLENDEYLCIPKYYGIEKFGNPTINKEIIGSPIDISFKGNLRTEQVNIINQILPKIEQYDGGLLSLGCGGGKCLAKNTKILMYDGTIKYVQDIQIGDKIMGDDSTPRNILSVTSGNELMYKITDINDNNSYIVNESHILSLKYGKTDEIIDITVKNYLNLPKTVIDNLYGYRVPINFMENEINIEPYNLGLWLGDESLYKIDNNILIKYNLINNKHIPYNYKCNSRKNQLLLLAGIIDSVGLYNNNYEIIVNNEILFDDIIFMTRSLGYLVKKCTNIYLKLYITSTSFSDLKEIPVLLSNPHNNIIDKLNYKINIEKLIIDDYYGFEIDGNRRFVLHDFTVTHNTVISLYIASVLKVKTLVIVHKSFLLNQWIERAKEFTNAKLGIIQQNKVEIDGNDIVIGMLQSIAKGRYSPEIFRDFGLVIFDEAHHAPSQYFSKALPIIACKKTLALSATPKRNDKLEKVLYWYFGNILYKAPDEIIKSVSVKIIKFISTDATFKEYKQMYGTEINRPKTINKLVEIKERNELIINIINDILKLENRKILILSDRIEHLHLLKKLICPEITTSYYIGGLKQSVLTESEKAQVIFASYSMASEALDIPALNTLLLVTPRKEVEQAVGRITRKKDALIQPIVIDIVDQLPIFIRQSYCRIKFYHKKGFNVNSFEIKDNKITNNNYLVNNNLKESNIISDEDIKDEFDFID
jgi:hypothetical protein